MSETKQLLIQALHEIRALRQNEILAAQIATVDVFAAAMKRNDSCMSVDIAWELERKIAEIKDQADV